MLVLAAVGALAASAAQAGNILLNTNFAANSGQAVATDWTYFDAPTVPASTQDYWIGGPPTSGFLATPLSGVQYWKEWGAGYFEAPTNNVAGIYQEFSGSAGSVYSASGWSYTSASDEMGADCRVWIDVSFLDSTGNILALYTSAPFSASTGENIWFQFAVTNACNLSSPVATGDPYFTNYAVSGTVTQMVAPGGTTKVRYRYAYLQAGMEGGSCYFDDPALIQSPGVPNTPTNIVTCSGDTSIVLHWDPVIDPTLAGYQVSRSLASMGPFVVQNTNLLTSPGFCDLQVTNGQTNYYQVAAVTQASIMSPPSVTAAAVANAFASSDQFLDYVQETAFDYFWYWANPLNGLIPDRSETNSSCSIAAVGFGLTAIGIGIDHGWITRDQGVARVMTTLNTFLQGPQGPDDTGVIGYNGWFYHFLEMNTALRANAGPELSSIDTALLLAGILYAKQYFNGTNANETAIRAMATAIFDRVNWTWMANGTDGVAMAWYPNSGFNGNYWTGYCEGMIIYCLGLGSSSYPLPASSWSQWTSGYTWATNYGQAYAFFPALFTYEYSHCWIDFRHVADAYMNSHGSTYFENSRRAALSHVAYCSANPNSFAGYSSNVWGLTPSDDPDGYASHGLPPQGFDDGTIAPTAAGGAIAFTPEYSEPALNYLYTHYRPDIWTAYGFRDAFNVGQGWYDQDELGIDEGPILIMIENYRTERPWQLFMQNPEVTNGLQRAGFVSLPLVNLTAQVQPAEDIVSLAWAAQAGTTYQVEYSPDLLTWFSSPTGEVIATGSTASWSDSGPPGTTVFPFSTAARYYRVFQFGSP